MKLEIGNKISWICALGNLKGTIERIVLDLNAANQTVPWLIVNTDAGNVRLCGTDSNLKMMQVQAA
jgi:hypothetical protein